MSSWQCGVCGFIHEEEDCPEKCPVCEAPGEKFTEIVEGRDSGKNSSVTGSVEKKWKCTVCGYVHVGTEPPETCPVCGASGEKFEEITVAESSDESPVIAEKRWRCTVCGYVHIGAVPPETCPVCNASAEMFLELDENGNEIGTLSVERTEPLSSPGDQESPSLFNSLATLFLRHHLHAISVHFPNGILPVVVGFLGISVWLNMASLEIAAFYNLIVVLLAMPLVLLSGYLEWQNRYKGIKTIVFKIKIVCALVVLATANVLVFWRIIEPGVMADGSSVKWIYLGVAAAMLGAAGLAGHLGGKLVFGSRG